MFHNLVKDFDTYCSEDILLTIDDPNACQFDYDELQLDDGLCFDSIPTTIRQTTSRIACLVTASMFNPVIPKSFKQAMLSPEASEWHKAMIKELSTLEDNNTWELVPKIEGQHVIPTKWVFSIKNASTTPLFKARLVVLGNLQRLLDEFRETFAPVVRAETVRLVLLYLLLLVKRCFNLMLRVLLCTQILILLFMLVNHLVLQERV